MNHREMQEEMLRKNAEEKWSHNLHKDLRNAPRFVAPLGTMPLMNDAFGRISNNTQGNISNNLNPDMHTNHAIGRTHSSKPPLAPTRTSSSKPPLAPTRTPGSKPLLAPTRIPGSKTPLAPTRASSSKPPLPPTRIPGSKPPLAPLREQDRYMPIANVVRIIRRAIPSYGKVSEEAKETMKESVSEFISFITSEANERCQKEFRKTVSAEDIIVAMSKLGFDHYVEPLTMYLKMYRENEADPIIPRRGAGNMNFEALGIGGEGVGPSEPPQVGQYYYNPYDHYMN